MNLIMQLCIQIIKMMSRFDMICCNICLHIVENGINLEALSSITHQVIILCFAKTNNVVKSKQQEYERCFLKVK